MVSTQGWAILNDYARYSDWVTLFRGFQRVSNAHVDRIDDGDASVNVVFRQLRIVIHDFRFRHAFRKAVQNHGNFNAGVANAGSSAAYIRLGGNPFHPFLFWHLYSSLMVPYY
jgi:hypothetical protein